MPVVYRDEKNDKLREKLRRDLTEMPAFVRDYMRAKTDSKETSTRYAYMLDIRIFLRFLQTRDPRYKDISIKDMSIDVLKNVTPNDILDYLEYLDAYDGAAQKQTNARAGKKRKLASLSALYTYFYRQGVLPSNPVTAVDLPKVHQKTVSILQDDEIQSILDAIESGSVLSRSSRERFHELTKYRDKAIVLLLLSSGMRVSELVGLNIYDIDFDHPEEDSFGNIIYEVVVIRKGGDADKIYIPEETVIVIQEYIQVSRPRLIRSKSDREEPALFISLRGKRISVGSVEAMIKKYTTTTVPTKNIHPHIFRKTRGTKLYNDTGDLKLTAEILGDKSLEVVNRHYVAESESRKKDATYKGQLP